MATAIRPGVASAGAVAGRESSWSCGGMLALFYRLLGIIAWGRPQGSRTRPALQGRRRGLVSGGKFAEMGDGGGDEVEGGMDFGVGGVAAEAEADAGAGVG